MSDVGIISDIVCFFFDAFRKQYVQINLTRARVLDHIVKCLIRMGSAYRRDQDMYSKSQI